MNTKRASAWALLALFLAFSSSLTACASKPEARGYIRGSAGLQVFESDKPDAKPITSPDTVEGDFNFRANPWRKPFLVIEAAPASVIRTTVGSTTGRLDGSGTTDEGKVLIIRK